MFTECVKPKKLINYLDDYACRVPPEKELTDIYGMLHSVSLIRAQKFYYASIFKMIWEKLKLFALK